MWNAQYSISQTVFPWVYLIEWGTDKWRVYFVRLNGQKLMRSTAGNEADPIISDTEEGRKSQQVT